MAEQNGGTQPAAKTESHDPDYPEAFLQFMRSGLEPRLHVHLRA